MERIQEAIEKARRERENLFSRAPKSNGEKVEKVFVTHDTRAIEVEYFDTRTHRLDEKQLKAERIIAGMAHHVDSEPYRQLRSQVLQKMRSNNWQTLAITSPNNGNGKSLTAINLAICLSQEVNQTVLLVDLDLKTPSISKKLGLGDAELGLTDYLNSQVSLDKILINPDYNRLVVLPANTQGHQTSEILSSPAMKAMQEELKNRYEDRIIIYDLPPLLVSDDAIVFTPYVDATLLVIEDGGSTKEELERCMKLLEDKPLVGTMINKAR